MEDSGTGSRTHGIQLPEMGQKSATCARANVEWLDLRTLCGYASVSERTLREWIHRPSDALPAYQIAKKIFVKRCEFDQWIRRHVINPTDEINVEGIVNEVVRKVAGTD